MFVYNWPRNIRFYLKAAGKTHTFKDELVALTGEGRKQSIIFPTIGTRISCRRGAFGSFH